jgi:hypothetical protein
MVFLYVLHLRNIQPTIGTDAGGGGGGFSAKQE